MNKIKTIDFCKKYKVPYVLMTIRRFKLPKPIVKHGITLTHNKKYANIPKGWKDLSFDELNEKYNNERDKDPKYNGINVNLNKGNLVVVDLDGDNAKDLLKEYGDEWKSKSCMRQLPHLWFNKHPQDNNTTTINVKEGVDLLYHNVIELKKQNIHNCDVSLRIFTDFPIVKKKPVFKIKSKINNNLSNIDMANEITPATLPTKEQKDIINNIDVKYLDNYGDWLKIMWGLFNTFHNIELCDTISKNSKKYTSKNDVIKYINCDKQKTISFGTISYYSKISNAERHEDIFFEHHIEEIMSYGDKDLSMAYLNLKNDNLIKHDRQIYRYSKPYWIKEDNLIKDISEVLDNTIQCKYNKIWKDIYKLECEKITVNEVKQKEINDEIKELKSQTSKLLKTKGKLQSLSKLKNITKLVEVFMINKNYNMNNIKPNYFCFSNCAFDMITREKITVLKSDYISNHTNYPYINPTQTEIDLVNKLIREIMPDEESHKCLLSILRSGCIGTQTIYFVLFNGDGSNGKGLLLEMVKRVLGSYYCIGNTQFLLEPIKQGANSALMNLHEKRMIVYSEPEEGMKLYKDTILKITDVPQMTGRGLYEAEDREINLHCVPILECNSRPQIRGKKDDAILRRIIDLHFSQSFTDNEDFLHLPNHHLINREYKKDTFKEKHKYAFFNILLNSTENNVYIPKSVKERGQKFLMDTDEILQWFNSNYTNTEDKNDFIKLKDIYNIFTQSTFFNSLSPRDRRENWNSGNFKDKIRSNIHLKKFYCDRKVIDGNNCKSILIGYKYNNMDTDL